MAANPASNLDFHSWESYLASWRRGLRAENKSPRTIETYLLAGEQIAAFCAKQDLPDDPRHVTRADIETFLGDMLEARSAATVKQRYSSLRNFFRWLAEEGEIDDSPMQHIKPPIVEETPPEVVSEEQLAAIVAAPTGNGFMARRDIALLRLFIDTGARLAEIANLRVQDIDLDLRVAIVIGKGRKHRSVPYGEKTAQALDRYLRVRSSHRNAGEDALWLGKRGPMTQSGIAQMVKRRGRQAGVDGLHPHLFRHTMAHHWLADGGQEHDLIRIAGWSDTQMLARYGASAAAERARAAHRRLSLGDQF